MSFVNVKLIVTLKTFYCLHQLRATETTTCVNVSTPAGGIDILLPNRRSPVAVAVHRSKLLLSSLILPSSATMWSLLTA